MEMEKIMELLRAGCRKMTTEGLGRIRPGTFSMRGEGALTLALRRARRARRARLLRCRQELLEVAAAAAAAENFRDKDGKGAKGLSIHRCTPFP